MLTMKTTLLLALVSLLGATTLRSQSSDTPVEFEKARQLFEKRQNGGTLTADEEAYIEKARAAHETQMKKQGAGGDLPPQGQDGIDWERAQKLHQRDSAGEKLSEEEKAYLDKARAAFAKRNGGSPTSSGSNTTSSDGIDWRKAQDLFRREQSGEKLNEADQKYLDHAKEVRRGGGGNNAGGGGGRGGVANQRKAPASLTPLTDMTADDQYEGEDGGLYGKGSNEPPEALKKSATEALEQIQPLNADGKPSSSGKIVFVSISMSNATQEYSRFKQIADADPRKSSNVAIVDCAQGGQAMAEWVDPQSRAWQTADQRLVSSGVSPAQVQVVWIKLANKGPNGTLENHGRTLERDTLAVIHNTKQRFPNLQIAYLGSRIYGGYTQSRLNPEPQAYEGAFVVRWMIQDQAKGNPELNYDADRGLVKAPVLLWGPYFWADGTTPRKSDGLVYERSDLAGDGTHPSESGRQKVAGLMLRFFTTDASAKSWFVKQ